MPWVMTDTSIKTKLSSSRKGEPVLWIWKNSGYLQCSRSGRGEYKHPFMKLIWPCIRDHFVHFPPLFWTLFRLLFHFLSFIALLVVPCWVLFLFLMDALELSIYHLLNSLRDIIPFHMGFKSLATILLFPILCSTTVINCIFKLLRNNIVYFTILSSHLLRRLIKNY